MKKILVIDGNSIINRAFYGVRALSTKSGKPTNAIFGMISIISRQLTELQPDYAAVAFDLKEPTFRHKMYPEYKAGRNPTPEDLLVQFPEAKECLSLMGLHILELPGYEADDLQGTVAAFAHQTEDTKSYILSGDRDLLQLIDDKITVLLATNAETKIMGEKEFTEEYGIQPSSFIDMKALMGDSSDNIPGVRGIGKKTAANLISIFGSLDGIYDNIDDPRITKSVREKLICDKESAYLSKQLATIITDAPMGRTLESLSYCGFNKGGLYKKFTELELNSFISKFGLKQTDSETCEMPKTEDETQAGFDFDSPEYKRFDADFIVNNTKKAFSLDILNGIVYIFTENSAISYDGELSDITKIFDEAEVICHDAKSLWHMLNKAGAKLSSTKFLDLGIYSYLLNPGSKAASIESLCANFAGVTPPANVPIVHLFPEIEKNMRNKIDSDGMTKILFDIEIPLINVLAEIEDCGFKIDPVKMAEFGDALSALAGELESRIFMQAGRDFNINSPKQLGEVLFEDLGLPCKKKKTKTGYSTDAETLEELRSESPIIDDILEYRQVTKLRSTYAVALPEAADKNNRIHTDFKQTLTATGRLSSADPNLQNIPIRTKMGREMRRYFIADEGYTLVDADYSQIELRLLAHIADDYTMKEAFITGEDIHRKTAAAVFGIPEEEVTEDMRKRAKAVNFGIIYGISGFSLSKDIGTSVDEASRYIKNYLMNYLSISEYLDRVVEEAKNNGYTTTVFGRRRYIPELTAPNGAMRAFGKRVAMNAPIQGTAADIMKMAMIAVRDRLIKEKLDAKIVMQVHDELVVEAKDEDAELCKRILREEMEKVAALSVPLTVDVTSGKNWLEQS
ncbi:MAG: DNA polymerase I [Clostridia bacterium]|nr:DNA polymerase I [Clostridia bacterium]